MCTLTLPKVGNFINIVLQQVQTKSYENTKFLKQINTHNFTYKV